MTSQVTQPRRPNGSRLAGMLAPVRRGLKPSITMVIGPVKSGKSTLAAGGPNPCFVLTDPGGMNSLSDDIPRYLPVAWDLLPGEKAPCEACGQETKATADTCPKCQAPLPLKVTVMGVMRALLAEDHPYQTIAIDTVSRAEAMLWEYICTREGVKSIAKADGGWGAGYVMAREHMTQLFNICAQLREQRGCEIFVMSHQEARNEHDAAGVDFEKWVVDIHKKAASVWLGGADNILYVEKETRLIQVGSGDKAHTQVEYTGRSIAHCRAGRGREAGNRDFLPPTMMLGYAILRQEREKGAQLREALFFKLASLSLEERAKAETDLAIAGWSREAVERVIQSSNVNSNSNINGKK